jgi:cytochrome c oxidase cbb3-type subunit 2
MNSGPLLFLGLFVTMCCSWLGFVLGPQLQIGDTRPTTNILVGASGHVYPTALPGVAHQGDLVYLANGCAACHTQMIRPRELGSDIGRNWGIRRSTAFDYLYDDPVLLGSLRVGPDLANAGSRMDAAAVLVQVYEPRAITRGSIMPAFHYLFEQHKIEGFRSPAALNLPEEYRPPAGYEIVPTRAALALANYVASLRQSGYLFEAPPPLRPPVKTNAPVKLPLAPVSK